MSMNSISGNTPSLQSLKAQQAWEARKANKPAAPQAKTEAADITQTSRGNQALASRAVEAENTVDSNALSPALMRMGRVLSEVKEIAERAGFVGVTDQDIHRAYMRGESLLTDYRV